MNLQLVYGGFIIVLFAILSIAIGSIGLNCAYGNSEKGKAWTWIAITIEVLLFLYGVLLMLKGLSS